VPNRRLVPPPLRWCVTHQALVDPVWSESECYRYCLSPLFTELCDLAEVPADPVMEMARIEAGVPVPEGWNLTFVSPDGVQLISRAVSWYWPIPVPVSPPVEGSVIRSN